MAIHRGQPVEENRGVEGRKSVGHASAGKPQARRKGQEHAAGDEVILKQSTEASPAGRGEVVRSGDGHLSAENSVVEQHSEGAVEPVMVAAEQIAQHPYVAVPWQAPMQTGYPSQYMNPYNNYAYYVCGDVYNSAVTSAYMKNYCYPVAGYDPYSLGYAGHFCYPQYPAASLDHYSVTLDSSPNGDVTSTPPESPLPGAPMLMTYGYQHPLVEHGQWVPLPMYASSVMGESVPSKIEYVPYSIVGAPDVVNVQPSAYNLQTNVKKGSYGEDLKCSAQLSGPKSDNELLNKEANEQIDDKILTVEDKRPIKKQLSLLYGPHVPIRGPWARSGHLHCVDTQYPLKALSNKSKSYGIQPSNAEPLVKAGANLENFSLDFQEAKHFVIKSFSEENVIRSIQYSVWSSTANGNKKLDEAYKYAQSRSLGKAKGCPVLLYFSVNGSGRFCGVAEMIGAVDYNNTMDFWERNRWCGSFPLKWHFIKDVPHSQLRRIILHNNENKPVTSSRDTQEVNFEQGIQMLSIIKSYLTKSSILDTPLYLQRVSHLEPTVKPPSPLEEKIAGDKDMCAEATQEPLESHTVLVNNNALRASNGKTRSEDGKLQGKESVDVSNHGTIEDSGGRNVENENVMIVGSIAVA